MVALGDTTGHGGECVPRTSKLPAIFSTSVQMLLETVGHPLTLGLSSSFVTKPRGTTTTGRSIGSPRNNKRVTARKSSLRTLIVGKSRVESPKGAVCLGIEVSRFA